MHDYDSDHQLQQHCHFPTSENWLSRCTTENHVISNPDISTSPSSSSYCNRKVARNNSNAEISFQSPPGPQWKNRQPGWSLELYFVHVWNNIFNVTQCSACSFFCWFRLNRTLLSCTPEMEGKSEILVGKSCSSCLWSRWNLYVSDRVGW